LITRFQLPGVDLVADGRCDLLVFGCVHGVSLARNPGLWRMEIGPTPPAGLLLELSAGSDVERWPIGLAQSRSLAYLSKRLVRRLDPSSVRAA
jgi:hypothetical protein